MSNIDEEIERYELSEEEFKKNADQIFAELAFNASKVDNPKFIIVGGQAGSGKTSLVAKKYHELQGNAIIVDQDEIRARYPKELYKQILEEHDDREEYLILKPYVLKMRQEIVDRARNGGYNVIMESAMQAVDSFIRQTNPFKEDGYITELSVISVPEIECYLSTLNRYCTFLRRDGICRRNTSISPKLLQNVRANITKLCDTNLYDSVHIYVRSQNINELPVEIYSNRENSYQTPLQAFDRGQIDSLKVTQRTFNERLKSIRHILEEFGEKEQLTKLQEVERQFNNIVDRGGLGE